MRIENDVKLDFKDVLIRPKRSTLTTRSQVDISREFRFRHTGTEYAGIPIVASNMDSTGTFEMARVLDGFKLSVALHKHYGVKPASMLVSGLYCGLCWTPLDGQLDSSDSAKVLSHHVH